MAKLCLCCWILMCVAGTTVVQAQAPIGPTRVDFDERLIQGQTHKAGSVYIFDRQIGRVKSLLNSKRRFLRRSIRDIFGE
jgi:hypothetical protein